MTDQPADGAWDKLGASPGLCQTCAHARLNETRKGTAYLRCTHPDLPRYPRLPVTRCPGHRSRLLLLSVGSARMKVPLTWL